jgi:hypothetical protein
VRGYPEIANAGREGTNACGEQETTKEQTSWAKRVGTGGTKAGRAGKDATTRRAGCNGDDGGQRIELGNGDFVAGQVKPRCLLAVTCPFKSYAEQAHAVD